MKRKLSAAFLFVFVASIASAQSSIEAEKRRERAIEDAHFWDNPSWRYTEFGVGAVGTAVMFFALKPVETDKVRAIRAKIATLDFKINSGFPALDTAILERDKIKGRVTFEDSETARKRLLALANRIETTMGKEEMFVGKSRVLQERSITTLRQGALQIGEDESAIRNDANLITQARKKAMLKVANARIKTTKSEYGVVLEQLLAERDVEFSLLRNAKEASLIERFNGRVTLWSVRLIDGAIIVAIGADLARELDNHWNKVSLATPEQLSQMALIMVQDEENESLN